MLGPCAQILTGFPETPMRLGCICCPLLQAGVTATSITSRHHQGLPDVLVLCPSTLVYLVHMYPMSSVPPSFPSHPLSLSHLPVPSIPHSAASVQSVLHQRLALQTLHTPHPFLSVASKVFWGLLGLHGEDPQELPSTNTAGWVVPN